MADDMPKHFEFRKDNPKTYADVDGSLKVFNSSPYSSLAAESQKGVWKKIKSKLVGIFVSSTVVIVAQGAMEVEKCASSLVEFAFPSVCGLCCDMGAVLTTSVRAIVPPSDWSRRHFS